MDVDPGKISFAEDPLGSLQFNKIIRMMCCSVIEGRSTAGSTGISVGQQYAVSVTRTSSAAAARWAAENEGVAEFQLQRSILWRKFGGFQDLGGESGTALYTEGAGSLKEIIGFQNYQWPGDTQVVWALDDEGLLSQTPKAAEELLAISSVYFMVLRPTKGDSKRTSYRSE